MKVNRQHISDYHKAAGDKCYVGTMKRVDSWERLRCNCVCRLARGDLWVKGLFEQNAEEVRE